MTINKLCADTSSEDIFLSVGSQSFDNENRPAPPITDRPPLDNDDIPF